MSAIEALYIFDEHNNLILDHVYHGRPPAPSILLPRYLEQPAPRPSLTYLPSFNPPTVLYSVLQDNLLFLSPHSGDGNPLLVLEFLHRVADALQEFLGSPLLANKITASYDVVAQVVAEIADAGIVCQGEANALRDVVETGPGVLKNLLGGLVASGPGLQGGSSSASGGPGLLRPTMQSATQGPAIPWRRSNVRHTSNEMYVDLVESLQVTMAPSGRLLAAFAYGSIAFTSKVSGVPDLILNLSTGGKGGGMGNTGEQLRRVMERVVLHPCVRLNRWQKDGVLSFVPPDGRFALCGYEVDLLGPDAPLTISETSRSGQPLNLPATLQVTTGLGPNSADFEVRLKPSSTGGIGSSAAAASLQSHLSSGRQAGFRGTTGSGDSKSPSLEDLTVHVPIPPGVRNLSELRPSKGEAHWNPSEGQVEWRVAARDFGPGGAVLRCTVQGPLTDDTDGDSPSGFVNGMTATTYDYDEDRPASAAGARSGGGLNGSVAAVDPQRGERYRELMPTSATLSFSVKGWLASGLKVESLLVDNQKSRGLGPDVKPYKGVKYLTVSRDGVEVRC